MPGQPLCSEFVAASPIGLLAVRLWGGRLVSIDFLTEGRVQQATDDTAKEVQRQLAAYFAEGAWPFDLPLELRGTTFQQRVWQALRRIPAGEVRSYGQLARQLGSSARAVGNACRANPLPIVVPCHRVVGAAGLGGYSGYSGETAEEGLRIKRWLLTHEGVSL